MVQIQLCLINCMTKRTKKKWKKTRSIRTNVFFLIIIQNFRMMINHFDGYIKKKFHQKEQSSWFKVSRSHEFRSSSSSLLCVLVWLVAVLGMRIFFLVKSILVDAVDWRHPGVWSTHSLHVLLILLIWIWISKDPDV